MAKSKLTPRQILTYLSIAALIVTLAGGAGYSIKSPGQAEASQQESLHKADKLVQAQVDKGQDERLEKIENHHQIIVGDLGGLKAGQKRIEESLERMANN